MSIVFDYEEINRRLNNKQDNIKCKKCEDNGWIYSSYQASHAPNFDICDDCYNPEEKLSPWKASCQNCLEDNFLKRIHKMTHYKTEPDLHYFCAPCAKNYIEYWDEMWKEYYASMG